MNRVDAVGMRAFVLRIAAVGFLLLAWSLWCRWRDAEPAQVFALDLPAAEETAAGSEGLVLHAALVGYTSLEAAMLDAVSVPIAKGHAFEFALGFQTAAPARSNGPGVSGFGSFGARFEWASRIRSVRELPEAFGSQGVLYEMSGDYLGAVDGSHGLQVRRIQEYHYAYRLGRSGSGNGSAPPDDLLMRVREPVVRIYPNRGNALFLMLTDGNDASPFDPGQRETWLAAFEEACGVQPLLAYGELAVALAAQADGQQRPSYERYAPRGFGPAAELVAAALVLRDAERAAVGLVDLRQEGALERSFAGGTRRGAGMLLDFYEEHYDEPRRRVTSALVRGEIDELDGKQELALLTVVDDAAIAGSLVDRLLARSERLREVLAYEELDQAPEVAAEYQRLRGEVIARLPFPWGVVLRSGWLLLVWLLLVPVLALVKVSLVRPAAGDARRLSELSPLQVALIGLCSFVSLGSFSLAVLLVPIWWLLALRWLRLPTRHGVAGRAVVWLALTLATCEGLRRVGWFVAHEMVEEAGSYAGLFCWCLVALLVAHEGGWRLARLRWFLLGLLGLHGLSVVGDREGVAAFGGLLLCLTAFALLAFVAGGRQLASPDEDTPEPLPN